MVTRTRRRPFLTRLIAPAAIMGSLALAGSATAAVPGWAPGGDPKKPETQHRADLATQGNPNECAANSIILFRVRGSGESYGTDKLGQWTGAMGTALIKRGWRVRDLQARYSAPGVPGPEAWKAAQKYGLAGVALAVKKYRDAASTEWQWVRTELTGAADRCPSRRIALAGYSQGNIILRYVLPNLPDRVLRQIVSVDLVSDPTADFEVDKTLATVAGDPDARRTYAGIDTWGARRVRSWFNQTRYPALIRGRTVQWCAKWDLVCDANANVGSLSSWVNVWKIHSSYAFAGIGFATAIKRIGNAPLPAVTPVAPGAGAPSTPSTPSTPSSPSTPVTPTTPSGPPAGVSDRLSNDGRLDAASNQFLRSANGQYRLVMQQDSNLVLYGPSGRPLWASNTVGRGANHLRMQGDGNMVIYNNADKPVWASNTPRHYNTFLVVQNDGNLVIYDGSTPIWSTNTNGRT